MSLLSRLLQRSDVECPRCLGKGHVDENDIKRLGKELKWSPGSCAYCNEKGSVSKKTVKLIDVDNEYLTSDLPQSEKQLILKNDKDTLIRAENYSIETNNFIKGIKYLSSIGNLSPDEITAFYCISEIEVNEEHRKELTQYIITVLGMRE